jgi:hypothetical protein
MPTNFPFNTIYHLAKSNPYDLEDMCDNMDFHRLVCTFSYTFRLSNQISGFSESEWSFASACSAIDPPLQQ